MLTLIDDSGETHAGRPLRGVGAPSELKAGVPVKLVWLFGGQNAFTGEKLPPPPAVKIKQFASVSFQPNVPGGNDPVEFRNVPSTVKKSKSK